jgi:hypothetical protein
MERGSNGKRSTPIFGRGDGGYQRFRIPTVFRLQSGTFIVFAEASTLSWEDNQADAIV